MPNETNAASKKVESCDHTELQQCLLKNNNDRSKCMKEWEDFQKACREKSKKVTLGAKECDSEVCYR
ncbi:hypothetical protein BC937DRAFT_92470 [Endogone sp. FLAS-F59071]|nr:hypothetical protein BC937DRAFT_92470 [Endogone sp. FLAS-F59071]|eukprot:RUS21501.1 hypothetical protein BC937DRAFT_92470 [Endogone sp. FLAS-F59071]